jgi:hypothetical protein
MKPDDNVCVCETSNGLILTDKGYCVGALHGVCVGALLKLKKKYPDFLLPYTLPSGHKVVGTIKDLLADHGKLRDKFDPRVRTPDDGARELFVCRLRSGIAIIETYDQCLKDGGEILGKLN